MLVVLCVNQLGVINLSVIFDKLQELAYNTGEEIFEMYRVPLDVIVSEPYMAFIVIMDGEVVFAYQIGDKI